MLLRANTVMREKFIYPFKTVVSPSTALDIKQQGFLLLEVMIAVFILAVGVLGMASLQIVSIRYAQEAYFVSQANIAVAGMAERMRINRPLNLDDGFTAYQFNGSVDQNIIQCVFPAVSCNAAQLVSYELNQWQQSLEALHLPLVKGLVNVSEASSASLAVVWDRNQDGQLDPSCMADSEDGCIQLSIQL